jgi:hypothetical protein
MKHDATIARICAEIRRLESAPAKAEILLRLANLRADLIERTNRLELDGWKIPKPLKQAMGVPA